MFQELHRAVSEALSDVAAGGISAYGMFLVPNHAQVQISNKNSACFSSLIHILSADVLF